MRGLRKVFGTFSEFFSCFQKIANKNQAATLSKEPAPSRVSWSADTIKRGSMLECNTGGCRCCKHRVILGYRYGN